MRTAKKSNFDSRLLGRTLWETVSKMLRSLWVHLNSLGEPILYGYNLSVVNGLALLGVVVPQVQASLSITVAPDPSCESGWSGSGAKRVM